MNAIQFYSPSSIPPSLSANCAAILQKHHLFKGVPCQNERNRVYEPFSQPQDASEERTGKQNKTNTISNCSISADEDDEFPSIDEVIRTQSSLLGHLDGSSKEQPVILDDDNNDGNNNDDNDNNDSEDDSDAGENNDDDSDSNSISSESIFSKLDTNGSPAPSSSHNPSLHPSVALHDQSPENQAIQQNDGYISYEMFEQPSCPALILSDDEENEAEKEQQQLEVGMDREHGAHNSDTSSNGNIGDDDGNQLPNHDESESLQPTQQSQLSPSYDLAGRRGRKRYFKKQEFHKSNNVDHKDDQDSDDSEDPRPIKRRWPSFSSSNQTQRQRLQRLHDDPTSNPILKYHLQQPCKRDNTPLQLQPTRAEYQEWPICGVLKQVIVGDEVHYGVEFNLKEPHACPQHTAINQSLNGEDPRSGDKWEIQSIAGMRKAKGGKEFLVAWTQTWMPESELGEAKELVEEFKGRLSVRHGKEKGRGKSDVTSKKAPRRQRGRPRKQV